MKTKFMLLISIILLTSLSVILVGFTFSGDASLDSSLSELNATAQLDFGDFKTEISLGYNIQESKIDYFHGTLKMEPADIFMAVEYSRIINIPVEKVVEVYQVNKGKGWGRIAKELGIKPGSAEFKALKGKAQGYSEKIKIKSKGKDKGNKNKK